MLSHEADMNRWILALLPCLIAACASNPKGSAKVKADKGSPASVHYVTAAELEKNLRAKGGDNVEIDVRMLPKGGRIFYESSRLTVSYGEQENTNPYLSVVENGKEIKFCDESDFESKNMENGVSSNGIGVAVPLKSNKVEMQCDLQRHPSGEFELRLLDSDKKVVEKYTITPSKAE